MDEHWGDQLMSIEIEDVGLLEVFACVDGIVDAESGSCDDESEEEVFHGWFV